ncbi:DUF4241 domain-containing protein [Paenibacillus sp. GCM10012307]|uniref:DUF4241 domain-containing protein n=1 Tax=Paenibacillus roseus TaxID=2798579 RepID=A0A934IZU0_9BACL|nr:DUF4241 domain-containing protein [Paenibacillus roseus]MBJ6360719.1 hypothetical protein [Paenibacillus roseus]
MIIQLGSFEVSSGTMIVADPCYEVNRDTIARGILDHALSGSWEAEVEKVELGDWGEVCAGITVRHSSWTRDEIDFPWVKGDFIVGVDSAQAGIFDLGKYRITDSCDGSSSEDWYNRCCDITQCGEEAGVLEGGVVTRTGIGAGAYGTYIAVNGQNQVIGVKIIFVKKTDY